MPFSEDVLARLDADADQPAHRSDQGIPDRSDSGH
jgi:hypothetical protein